MYSYPLLFLGIALFSGTCWSSVPTIQNRYQDIEAAFVGMLIKPEEEHNNPDEGITTTSRKLELPSLTRADLVFASLEKLKSYIAATDPLPQSNVIDQEVWQNLEFFTNASRISEKTVVGSLKRTKTMVGELTLTRLLLDPLTDLSCLQGRQQFIKRLTTDDHLFNTLQAAVTCVAAEEVNLIAMLRATDFFNQEIILNWYDTFGRIPSPFMRSTALNALHLTSICMLPFFCYTAGIMGKKAAQGIKSYEEHQNAGLIAVFALISALSGYRAYETIGLLKDLAETTAYIQRRLSAVHVLLLQLPIITAAAKTSEFSEFSVYSERYAIDYAPQLKPLAKRLSSGAFTPPKDGSIPGIMQSILSNQGTVANALLEAKKVLPTMLNGLVLVGYIDAYLSIATLMRERQQSNAPYCFVEFITDAQTPIIHAQDFYHPAIPADKVVLNTLSFAAPQHPNNLIISGVNAGGKSTIMKALALGCLLGQSIGIAPARRFVFTPFHRIGTYLNITDDSSKQQSLFRAELARALALLKRIDELPQNQFSLTILDEICTGTEARVGEALAFAVAEKLATYPNSITLLSTHFSGLVDLETQDPTRFKNMKVVVQKDATGNFVYPYHIQFGATTQQIAPDLLEQIGLPSVMTKKMRDVLNNPHHYLPKKDRI